MTRDETPWRKRQQIPDAQIRDAADQYEAARKLLAAQPPGAGVVLPLINTSAMAIELYLKRLSAELVYTSVDDFAGLSLVTAASTRTGHKLTLLFDELADGLKQDLEAAYKTDCFSPAGRTFREVIEGCQGAFVASRYPFEPGMNISNYPLRDLQVISEFLSDFISKLPPREYIEWK
jgi:hypothetical protein